MSVKIFAALAVALLVAVVVGVTGLGALSETNDRTQRMYTSNISSVAAVGELRETVFLTRLDTTPHLLAKDPAGVAKFRQAVPTPPARSRPSAGSPP